MYLITACKVLNHAQAREFICGPFLCHLVFCKVLGFSGRIIVAILGQAEDGLLVVE